MEEQIKGKWRVVHPDFYGYVIGSDRLLYKLPYESASKKHYLLREVALVNKSGTKGYWLIQGKDKYFWSLVKIKRELQDKGKIELIEEPEVLIDNKEDMPF